MRTALRFFLTLLVLSYFFSSAMSQLDTTARLVAQAIGTAAVVSEQNMRKGVE